jgi:hypothetical protein
MFFNLVITGYQKILHLRRCLVLTWVWHGVFMGGSDGLLVVITDLVKELNLFAKVLALQAD